jgi:hypothetical protein
LIEALYAYSLGLSLKSTAQEAHILVPYLTVLLRYLFRFLFQERISLSMIEDSLEHVVSTRQKRIRGTYVSVPLQESATFKIRPPKGIKALERNLGIQQVSHPDFSDEFLANTFQVTLQTCASDTMAQADRLIEDFKEWLLHLDTDGEGEVAFLVCLYLNARKPLSGASKGIPGGHAWSTRGDYAKSFRAFVKQCGARSGILERYIKTCEREATLRKTEHTATPFIPYEHAVRMLAASRKP